MNYTDLLPQIRSRIYDDRNPILIMRVRTSVSSDGTVTVSVGATDAVGAVSVPTPGTLEGWTYTLDRTKDFTPLYNLIKATPGWEIQAENAPLFFLQENLMQVVAANAKLTFVDFRIRYRFSDAEIQREIDSVIAEIDTAYTIASVPMIWHSYIVNEVSSRLLMIRAADSFGGLDIDVQSITIPGISVSFKTLNALWSELSKYYHDLAEKISEDSVGDEGMPDIREHTFTSYDPYYGSEVPYAGVAKPKPSDLSFKVRGTSPLRNVLLEWTAADRVDFKEYVLLRSESEIDIPEDGVALVLPTPKDIQKNYFVDTTVEDGKTYYYRLLVRLTDIENTGNIYSLSNQAKVQLTV